MAETPEKASRAECGPPVAADRTADAATHGVTTNEEGAARRGVKATDTVFRASSRRWQHHEAMHLADELVWDHALIRSLAACIGKYDPEHKLAGRVFKPR